MSPLACTGDLGQDQLIEAQGNRMGHAVRMGTVRPVRKTLNAVAAP